MTPNETNPPTIEELQDVITRYAARIQELNGEVQDLTAKLALEEADAEDMRVLDATVKRQAAAITELRTNVRRLQNDLADLSSIREYLRDLIPIHRDCAQLVDIVIATVLDANDPRHKLARAVEKKLKTHAQR